MADRANLVIPSIAEADPEERAHIDELVAPELEWYRDYPSYRTNSSMVSAWVLRVADIRHVSVGPDIAPIMRLRNPDRIREFPPLLLPGVADALDGFGRAWRNKLEERGIKDPALRLAVTSLGRSEEMQQALANNPKKLAAQDSSHTRLAAFDIDASGYYVIEPGIGLASCPHPDRPKEQVQNIGDALEKGDRHPTPTPISKRAYDPRVAEAALIVASEFHARGFINRVVEYPDTSNQCLHISPNPNETDWLTHD